MKKWWIGMVAAGLAIAGVAVWLLLRPAVLGPGEPTPPAPSAPIAGAPPGPGVGTPEAPGAPGGGGPAAPGTPAILPAGTPKTTHWFLQLGAEGMGLPRQEWLRLRMTTPHLGVPKGGQNPTVLPGFDYVTIANPVGKTSEDNGRRARQLIEEARRQKLPTMAHLIGQVPSLDALETRGKDFQALVEFLLPVPPGTRVEAPLVLRHMPDLRVYSMEAGVPGQELNKALQALVAEARAKGLRIVPPLLGQYDGEDWLEAAEKGTGERLRVYLVVEEGG